MQSKKYIYRFKYCITVFVFFLLQTNSFSQMGIRDIYNIFAQNDSKLIGTNKLGLSYSGISSYGLTYQGNLEDIVRVSMTTFVSVDSYYSNDFVDYNFGLQLQKTFIGDNSNYAYFFVGAGITNTNFSDSFNEYLRTEVANTYGIGIGGSVRFLKHFSLDLELGYGYCNTNTIFLEFNQNNVNNTYEPRERFGTTFGLGLYYLF